jgi:hypothetical protein
VCSSEEVHLLGLFDDDRLLGALQEIVNDNLAGENDPETFGEQLIVDHGGELVGQSKRLLIGATSLSLDEIVQTVHELGGLAIASHVDRPSFSVVSQLGFVPENLDLDAVEVRSEIPPGLPEDLPVIFSSDAHRREEIGAVRTGFRMEDATVSELEMALRGEGGREIVAEP